MFRRLYTFSLSLFCYSSFFLFFFSLPRLCKWKHAYRIECEGGVRQNCDTSFFFRFLSTGALPESSGCFRRRSCCVRTRHFSRSMPSCILPELFQLVVFHRPANLANHAGCVPQHVHLNQNHLKPHL